MPAGALPAGEVSDRLRDAVPPGVVDPDASTSESAEPATVMLSEAVCVLLPSVAVITAVWVAVTVPAVAVKPALLAPLDTITDAGTERLALLLLKATAVLAGAV